MDSDLFARYIADRLTPAQCCQAVFFFLTIGVLTVNALPAATRRHLLDYGAREDHEPARTTEKPDLLEQLVATLAAHSQVPHAWFSSFYAVYLVCAAGWAALWLSWWLDGPGGWLFAWILEQQAGEGTASIAVEQACAAYVCMALQTARRLFEQVYVVKPSKSKMNVSHWILGLAFYVCMSMAVWIGGSQSILATKDAGHVERVGVLGWLRLLSGTAAFLVSSLKQFQCHRHLASLKKYTLPEEGMFHSIVCPHYTCEIGIYLALAYIAAPLGSTLNQTLLTAVLFETVCLGVTAGRTKVWYVEKFGQERVTGKWKMIPFVF